MDKQTAKTDIQSLRELLDSTASKSKKHEEKADEYRITFKNLEQYPYVMRQLAWELEWDKVQGLYDLCIGVPAFIIDDAIVDQWSPMASPTGSQWWTGSDDLDTLYAHAVLLLLMPLNLLDPTQEREQGNYGSSPKQFMSSAVVVFVHPSQVLTTIQNAVGFFKQQYNAVLQGGHSNGWCIFCKLPRYETSQYFAVIPQMPYLALPMLEPTADLTV